MAKFGAITPEDREFVEEWENIATPSHSILKLDIRGDVTHEVISGRRRFHITSAERKITQDKILRVEDDPFLNGSFRPVVVPDSVNTDTNPNALSDDEIRSILVSSAMAWDEWMTVIDSPDTLGRMMDLADGAEELTLKRYKQLAAKLVDVRPRTQIVDKNREALEKLGGTPRG